MYDDNGYKSRKLVMSYAVMGLMTAGFVATGFKPALAVTYPEFCMAVLAATSIYVGGNAAVKWIATRSAKTPTQE